MKKHNCVLLSLACIGLSFSANGKNLHQSFDTKIQENLERHIKKYASLEYFSGAGLSLSIPDQGIKNFYAGTVSHTANSKKIDKDTLFQIGSITKSFTAAIMLQLEKEKKLKLDDLLNAWLPEYQKWSDIKLETLLNMSSGLPNYSDTPLWNTEVYKNPGQIWSNEKLIEFVYPQNDFNPPIKSGYFYSNTGYILAEMIIKKITENTFKDELVNRIFKNAKLENTFYPVPSISTKTSQRIASGYNYNQYENPALLGQDISKFNLSWAASAGGLVSNTEDITKWVKALFIDNQVLDKNQQKKLKRMISTETGKAINQVSETNTKGVGLGVIQSWSPDPAIKRFWYYQGETLGFRALYMYTPCNQVIISTIFNSATNAENDHAKELMLATYKLIVNNYPALQCH